MNAEVKAKWIEALRSGNYKQGTGVLRSKNNDYCCLGVLCEVMGVPASAEDGCFYKYDGEFQALSADLLLMCQMSDTAATICIQMNDADHASFSQIADWLEGCV